MRVALGIVGLCALVGLAMAPLMGRVERTGRSEHQVQSAGGNGDNHQIKGSMTLREAAARVGMPIEQVLAKLDLPADADPDERLGRLRNIYGFEMSDVREILQQQEE